MNEELENQLAQLVSKAIEAAEKTGDFVIEQAPDLLQQFYAWHIASSVFFIVLGLILIAICFLIPRIIGTKRKAEKYEIYIRFMGRNMIDEGGILGFIAFCVAPFIAGCIVLLKNIYELIFILVAPKIYLIEYFL